MACIYLNYDISVRKKTALTCCKLLSQINSVLLLQDTIIKYM